MLPQTPPLLAMSRGRRPNARCAQIRAQAVPAAEALSQFPVSRPVAFAAKDVALLPAFI